MAIGTSNKGLIYFIKDEHERVKIGFTNGGVKKRLRHIQHNNADLLTVLGVLPGTLHSERQLQKQFQSLHIRGEWFWLKDKLMEYIKQHAVPAPPERDYKVIKVYSDGSRLLQGYIRGVLGTELPTIPTGCELEILEAQS